MNLGIHMKNINKLLSLAVFVLLLGSTSFTLAEEVAVELKPGHPQQYTVKKGDTLWDISGTFLKQPCCQYTDNSDRTI